MTTCLRILVISSLICASVYLTGCSMMPMQKPAELEIEPPPDTATAAPTTIIRPARSIETRTLQRLLTELQRFNSLVNEASLHADPDARIRFDYRLLSRDLKLIGSGIEAHIRAEQMTPPSIEPIAGDYRR